MRLVTRIALAAALATSFAAPVMAGQWVYHGGPKGPDSMQWYEPDDYAYGVPAIAVVPPGYPPGPPAYGPGYQAPPPAYGYPPGPPPYGY